MNPGGNDRRGSPRAPTAGVVVRVTFQNRRQLKRCWVKDLAKGGMFLRTPTPLEVSEAVTVVLELPDRTQLELHGTVVHVIQPDPDKADLPTGMGVQFGDLTADKRRLIEHFLERHKTLPVMPTQTKPLPSLQTFVQTLRRLVWLAVDPADVSAADYYLIVGVPPTATTEEIREACAILRILIDPTMPPDGLTPDHADRARVTLSMLQEIEATLVDPERRREYDAARRGD